MNRSALVKTIEDTILESGVTDDAEAEELAGDIADRLEEDYGLVDEDEEEEDEEDEED